jgi:hypothetical protein
MAFPTLDALQICPLPTSHLPGGIQETNKGSPRVGSEQCCSTGQQDGTFIVIRCATFLIRNALVNRQLKLVEFTHAQYAAQLLVKTQPAIIASIPVVPAAPPQLCSFGPFIWRRRCAVLNTPRSRS